MKKILFFLTMMILMCLPTAMQAQVIVDFENHSFSDLSALGTVTNDATYAWTVVNNAPTGSDGSHCNGSYCMKSGNGGIGSSTSSIQITVTYLFDGSISFLAGCWGEGSDTYDWDKCRFYIDDVCKIDYGAHQSWEALSWDVSAGTHTFKWTYKKDASVNSTEDAFFVDDIEFDGLTIVTCPRAGDFTVSDLLPNSADLSWAYSGSASSWDIFVTTSDTIVPNENTTPTGTSETEAYHFSDLVSQTTYYVYVRAHCDGNEVSRWKGTSFMTPQILATLPYDHDFENANENANWGIFNGSYINKWYIDTAANNTEDGEFALYVSKDTGRTNSYNISSQAYVWAYRDIDFGTAAEYQISFDWRDSAESCCDYLKVFIGELKNPATFGTSLAPTGLTTIAEKLNNSRTWTRDTFLVNSTFNGVQRLYFLWRNDGSGGTTQAAAVDNIHIEGTLCGTPLSVVVREKTDETITIKINPALASDEQWDLVVMNHDSLLNEELAIPISDTLYTIEGLTGNTVYDIYVRTACGSNWQSVKNVRTDCSIYSIPFTDNFDNTGASSRLPYCWNKIPATATYPYTSTTNFSAPYSLYLYAASGVNNIAVMPEFDPNVAIQDLTVSFMMRASNVTYNLYVGVVDSLTSDSTFVTLDSARVTTANTWEEFEFDLADYTGQGRRVAFKVTGHSGTENVYIDNVSLYPTSSCLKPFDLTYSEVQYNSIKVNWTPRGEESAWNVVAVPHGQDPDAGTVLNATEHPYIIEALEPNTQYDIYVQAVCGTNTSFWSVPVSCQTKCAPTDQLPYAENFDSYENSGSAVFPNCWTRKTNSSTLYPYINTTYHASGAKSLYFYNSAATNYCMAATQALDLSQVNVSDYAIYFKLYKTYAYYGRVDVGFMTNPDDLSTFTVLKSITSSDFVASKWTEFIVSLPELNLEEPVYIAFYAPAGGTNTFYMDDFKVDMLPTCSAPSNLTVSSVAGASALVSWDAAPYGIDNYTLEYTVAEQDDWTPVTTTETSLLLTGLTQGTSYKVMLHTTCANDHADTLRAVFSTRAYLECAQEDNVGTAITGSDSTTSYNVPVNNYYNYTYSQQIYTANEINPAHTPTVITGIAFKYIHTAAMTKKNDVKIYLAHRSDSTFASTTDWTPIADATLVYEGGLNCTQGWNSFTFDHPFSYNGTDNLVVIVDDNSGAEDGTAYNFNTHTKTNSVLYYRVDAAANNPNPSNPPTASAKESKRNHIKLFLCDQVVPVSCIVPNLYDYTIESDQITLNWVAGSNEEAWELQYQEDTSSVWNSIQLSDLTENTYTLEDLTPNTDYTLRMRSVCGDEEYSDWTSTLKITTPCEDIIDLPFTEDFNNAATGTAAAFLDCWTRKTNYSTNYPYVNVITTTHDTALYFYGSSSYYAYAATPRFAEDILMDSLQILFDARRTADNYLIEVGIMTNPDDQSTFELLGTFSPSANNEWQTFEIKTSGYNGNGHYIAFRTPQWATSYMYVDNIHIDYIPNCLHVENIQLTEVTATTATISWTPGADESNWLYVYGKAGSVDVSALEDEAWIPVSTNTAELTELTGNTAYEIFIKAACDNGEISSVMSYPFRTACVTISSLPYIENFDNWGQTSTTTTTNPGPLPACWDRSISTYTTPHPYCSSTYHYNGTSALYFYASGAGYTVGAVAPELDESIELTGLQLSFMYRAYSTTYTCKLIVGVMDSPNDLQSFTPVDTITATSTDWKQARILFENYTGTGKYIAIRNLPTATYYFIVDNFVIDEAPTCADPQHLAANTVGAHDAILTWEADEEESSYQLLTVLASDDPDFSAAVTIDNVGDHSYQVTELEPNKSYTCWLRTVCSDGSGHSNWVSTSFTTLSKDPAIVPYYHYFEDEEENGQYTFVNGTQVNKWYIGQPSGESDNVLFISQDGTIAEYDSTTEATVWAYRDFNFGASAEFTLSFSWKAAGEQSTSPWDYMKVYIGRPNTVSAGSTTVPTGAVQLGNALCLQPEWQRFEAALGSEYANSTQRVYFLWRNDDNTGELPAALVDSISIDIPSCIRPYSITASNITGHTADITIVPNQATDVWEYAVCAPSGNPDTVETHDVSGTTFTVTGLEPITAYTVYVRTVCGSNEHSTWISCAVKTTCEVEVAPYSEDFQTGFGSSIHPCWSRYSGLASDVFGGAELTTTTSGWNFSSTNVFGQGHPKVNIYGTSCKYWLVSPAIDLSQLTEPILSFDLALIPWSSSTTFDTTAQVDDQFMVIISTDNGATWSEANATIWNNSGSGDYRYNAISHTGEEIVIPLSQYANNTIKIAFYGESTATGGDNDLHIDNVSVGEMPTCPKPTALTATASTTSSITLSWTNGGSEEEWDIAYALGTSTFNPDTATQIAHVTSNPATVTGLSSSSQYTFYVRAACTPADQSLWSNSCVASTECDVITTLPYNEDFDSYEGTTYNDAHGIAPNCWTTYGVNTTYGAPHITGDGSYHYVNSGTNCLAFTCGTTGSGTEAYAALPSFADPLNTLELTFWRAMENISQGTLTVGYVTNLNNLSGSYVVVETIPSVSTSSASTISVDFSTANNIPANANICFKWQCSGSYYTCCIDDITVSSTSVPPVTPCEAPTAVTATNVSQTEATISWTAGGSETEWYVEYQAGEGEWQHITANNQPTVDITGLTASTTYNVRVKAVCSADNQSDFATGSFTTLDEVGTNDLILAQSISLMPNPADRYIDLRVNGNMTVKEAMVYNAFGQLIQTVELTDNHVRIDLSGMAAGMYFVRVNGDNGTATKKFIRK